MLLVDIPGFADAALELYAAALLNHVRCFVSGRVEIRGSAKDDVVAGGEGLSAHRPRGLGSGLTSVRLDVDGVTTERAPNQIAERQRMRGSRDAVRRRHVHISGRGLAGGCATTRHLLHERFNQGSFAGRERAHARSATFLVLLDV